MSVFNINGVSVTINEGSASPMQVEQLTRSLQLLPRIHLARLPEISVVTTHGYRGGSSRNPTSPDGGSIHISSLCFSSAWNQGAYNQTLLHECGHIIDWTYHCTTYLRQHDRAGYDALLGHAHSGRTQGAGEHFADAYKDYFIGRIDSARRNALLHSPAFVGLGN